MPILQPSPWKPVTPPCPTQWPRLELSVGTASPILQGIIIQDWLSYLEPMETKPPRVKKTRLRLILCFFYEAIRMPRFTHFRIPN